MIFGIVSLVFWLLLSPTGQLPTKIREDACRVDDSLTAGIFCKWGYPRENVDLKANITLRLISRACQMARWHGPARKRGTWWREGAHAEPSPVKQILLWLGWRSVKRLSTTLRNRLKERMNRAHNRMNGKECRSIKELNDKQVIICECLMNDR